MTLGEATRQYQDALEAFRQDDEDEDLARELLHAYNRMEHLWLEDNWERSPSEPAKVSVFNSWLFGGALLCVGLVAMLWAIYISLSAGVY